jgi:hypothetical protein
MNLGLSPVQRDILTLLKTRGHAMFGREIAAELGKHFIDIRSIRRLAKHDAIKGTNQGWMITELGIDNLAEGRLA